jgi:hypothetical protein
MNVAAKALGIPVPPSFIDDNVHTGILPDLEETAPKYYTHLANAGLSDKPAKRETLIMLGEILGIWFDSIAMTLSIPQDKLTRLMLTLQQYVDLPKISLKEMMELLGY